MVVSWSCAADSWWVTPTWRIRPSRFQAFIRGMMTGALVMLWHCIILIVSRQVRSRDCRRLSSAWLS